MRAGRSSVVAGAALLIATLGACSSGAPGGTGPGSSSTTSSSSSGATSSGGTGGGSSATALPDPCALITRDEAAAAVGGAMAEGRSDLVSSPGMPDGRSCSFRAASGPGALEVTIWRVSADRATTFREQKRGFGDIQDVAGIGDSAYRVGYNELVVRKGDYLLGYGIELVKYHPDAAQAGLKSAATATLARLR